MKLLVTCFAMLAVLAAASTSAAIDPPRRAYFQPAWSPDGRSITFAEQPTAGARGDLFVANADGTNIRKLTSATGGAHSHGARFPTWSPDSRRIAFGFGDGDIDVINVDGTGLRKVATGCCPDWSPGGRWLAFIDGFETEPSQVFAVHPNGRGRTLVVAARGECGMGAPTWSPDGQRLVFAVNVSPECGEIHRSGEIRQFRGRIRTLVPLFAPNDPDWSPDGRRLVFSHDGAIYVMSAAGTGVTELYPG